MPVPEVARAFFHLKVNFMQLRHFSPDEFTMDGLPVFDKMQPGFLELLDECRERAGVPFKITSSYRTPEKNRMVGGSPTSMHLKGRAVDIACTTGRMRARVMQVALGLGLSVGVMQRALHLDDRAVSTPIVFDYYGKYKP